MRYEDDSLSKIMIRRLTAEDITVAKRLLSSGMLQREAAEIFGVERSTIAFAVSGKAKTPYPSENDRYSTAERLRRLADEMEQLPDKSRQFAFMREIK